jgi:phosphotransferase system enzyme I (PtsP)
VGQGITGTAVESLRPVTVDDAAVASQFAYFPQLAEERYPSFLAVPLVSGTRPVGALVLQREKEPFRELDVLLALGCARSVAAMLEVDRPTGAHLVLNGAGNGCGRAVAMARVLSRVLTRREGRGRIDARAREEARRRLSKAIEDERAELRGLLEKARATARFPGRLPVELQTVIEDGRIEERAIEHLGAGLTPAQALERLAAEAAKTFSAHGPMARRALEVEAFASGVAHRYAGLEADRVRKGELIVSVQLSAIAALRAWSHGAVAALCQSPAEDSPGVALLTALELPVVSQLRHLFDRLGHSDRVAVDSGVGEVVVNPNAAQVAAWKAG